MLKMISTTCLLLFEKLQIVFLQLIISDDQDIIDETLNFFKANVFFKNFEINGNADRLLIYLTLYTTDCIVKLQKVPFSYI